jgi:hypothetical protein
LGLAQFLALTASADESAELCGILLVYFLKNRNSPPKRVQKPRIIYALESYYHHQCKLSKRKNRKLRKKVKVLQKMQIKKYTKIVMLKKVQK